MMLLPTYKGFTLGYAFKCALASSLIEMLITALVIYNVCKNRKRRNESAYVKRQNAREIARANTTTAVPYGEGPAAAYVETGVHIREEATIEHTEHGTVFRFVRLLSMYQLIHTITGRGHD